SFRPAPAPASPHPLPARSPLLSHTIPARVFIRIMYLISEYTGDQERYPLLCLMKKPSFVERVVVHVRVTGPRGPRARRRSGLAGPRPDDRRGARGIPGPA